MTVRPGRSSLMMESSSDFKNTNLTLLDLNIPREVLEIILAYCFRPFLLEDQLIRDQIISKFFDEPHLQDAEMDSVFVRQKQIYQFASSLLTVCRAFYVALRNSNVIWEKIFRLTLGARSWLAKTPAVIQTEFHASYYQACRYLMTFGKQFETADFAQLDPELICIGVGTSFVLFQQDEKVVRYDLISRSFVPLRSVQLQTGFCAVRGKYLIMEDGDPSSPDGFSVMIYDVVEDKLLQRYDSVARTAGQAGWVLRHTSKLRYGDWLSYRFLVHVTHESEPAYVMLGISQHEMKDEQAFDYLTFKDDGTHYVVMRGRADATDVLLCRVMTANRSFESIGDFYEERNPITDKSLSRLPVRKAKLLGNFALTFGENEVVAMTTSLKSATKQFESKPVGFIPEKYCIRGNQLLVVHQGKCFVASLSTE